MVLPFAEAQKSVHDLAVNIPQTMRHHRTQEGVGHYGLFNGKSWRRQIAPDMIAFTRRMDQLHGLDYPLRQETVRSLNLAGLWHDDRASTVALEPGS